MYNTYIFLYIFVFDSQDANGDLIFLANMWSLLIRHKYSHFNAKKIQLIHIQKLAQAEIKYS